MKKGNPNDRTLIFGFLRRMLDKNERDDFNTRMKEDSFLEETSEETVKQYGRIQLKSKLDDIHDSVEKEGKKNRILQILVLLAILALITAFVWVSQSTKKSITFSSDQIYAEYFEPYESLFDKKGETVTDENDFSKAMKAYKEEDYQEASRMFENLLGQDFSERSLYSFYYGVALLANEESGKALNVFQILNDSGKSSTLVPKESLQWYLALAYLKENKTEEAKPLLESLASQNKSGFKASEAKEMLNMLVE